MYGTLFLLGVAGSWILRRRARCLCRAREARLRRAMERAADTLRKHRNRYAYLTSGEQERMEADLSQAERAVRSLVYGLASRLAGLAHTSAAQQLVAAVPSLRNKVAEYNERHVKSEIQHHRSMLQDALGLDLEQCRAAVRDDTNNVVVAGPGAGKTRVLSARIRYLSERRDRVDPEHILAVTFTNKAADEMKDRLQHAAVVGPEVSTLHSLGNRVLRSSRSEPFKVAESWRVRKFIRDQLKRRSPTIDRLYGRVLVSFFHSESETAALPDDRDERSEYRTLLGGRVKSLAEQMIADFLTVNGVRYKYEELASWADQDPRYAHYQPDFYLPDDEVYIEHWGVDEQGRVPDWFSSGSWAYRRKVRWARRQFERHAKTLVETYDHERRAGRLRELLTERLQDVGVELAPLPPNELRCLLNEHRDLRQWNKDLVRLLQSFIDNARALGASPGEIRRKLRSARSPRVREFGKLGLALLRQYEEFLDRECFVDFNTMLHEAADWLERGEGVDAFAYSHILVDEFQDTSPAMARLLVALRNVGSAKLFCVGDDWQGIFGFQGADVGFMVDFEEHFGLATSTPLATNYRSSPQIVEAGLRLMRHNQRQLPKSLQAVRATPGSLSVHPCAPDEDAMAHRAAALIESELGAADPAEIMVISRVNWPLDAVRNACERRGISSRAVQALQLVTAHRAKGSEAKTVLVLNASDDLYGFPSKVEDPDVLEPVRLGAYESMEEERRVFFVALTRAQEKVHLLVHRGAPSPFLAEIDPEIPTGLGTADLDLTPGQRISDTLLVRNLFELTQKQKTAQIVQAGILQNGNYEVGFTSWAKDDPPSLVERSYYDFKGLRVVEPFRGKPQVRIDQLTTVDPACPKAGARDTNGYELRL